MAVLGIQGVYGRDATVDFAAMASVEQDFPLFPLGLVALPHELVPLHIFEERYKTMVGEALDNESEFGIIWLSDDGLKPVGCACRVEKVLERAEDGRLNIVCRGTRPFRLVERVDHLPYPAGVVEWIDDKDEEPDETTLERAREAYGELVEQATDEPADPEKLASMDAYAMAATVDFGLDAKQGLLDLRSENARLRLVTRLFRAAVKRLDFVERAQARARSNGKVRFG
jgi:Lon protease-like protein